VDARRPQARWIPRIVSASILLLLISLLLACAGGGGGAGEASGEPGPSEPDPCEAGACEDTTCQPSCEERACGPDGCGGSCGACAAGTSCDEQGACAPDEIDPGCEQTCAELDLECGEHCGEDCGACPGAQDGCVDGLCVCQPACGPATCGQGDGCGGTCGPCPVDQSCSGCALSLSLVDEVVKEGRRGEITLAIDYQPGSQDALPGMADLRVRASGPVSLRAVGVGPPVRDADKELHVDPVHGRPFRLLEDGVAQVLVFSSGSMAPIEGGRWLLLRFRFEEPGEGAQTPAVFEIVKRPEIFAPMPADAALWSEDFGGPVVVWPEVTP
jgi:hypothetical protein